MKRLLVILLLGMVLAGCGGVLRVKVQRGDRELLVVKCSAPSLIEYRHDGKLIFSRKGEDALPPSVECGRRTLRVTPP